VYVPGAAEGIGAVLDGTGSAPPAQSGRAAELAQRMRGLGVPAAGREVPAAESPG
jgi:hypothetical protein